MVQLSELEETQSVDLLLQEHRGGWLGMPRRFSVLDLAGTGLGVYMGYMGVRELRRSGAWQGALAIGLGAVMIWIHTQRFFYAPQDQGGFIRLARGIGITQQDLDRLRPMLAPAARTSVDGQPPHDHELLEDGATSVDANHSHSWPVLDPQTQQPLPYTSFDSGHDHRLP